MNEMKHYLVYLITNTVNGKIYIGKHETYNVDDGYMGSGKILKLAQCKYGLDKFTKEILADFSDPDSMNNMEALLVDEEFVKRKDTYNITLGGNGGFWYANRVATTFDRSLRGKIIVQRVASRLGITVHQMFSNLTKCQFASMSEADRIKKSKACSKSLKLWYKSHPGNFLGKRHSEETKQKIGYANSKYRGAENHNYGKHWWKDPNDKTKSMSIKEGDPVPEGWVRGRWDNTVRPHRAVKQHTCRWCGATGPKGKIFCNHPEVCKKYKLFPKMIQYFGMDASCIGTERLYDEYMRIKIDLHKKYFDDEMSAKDIANLVAYPYGPDNMAKFLIALFEGETLRKREEGNRVRK